MTRVCLILVTYTPEGSRQSRAADIIIPGIPRKGEIVVVEWQEYTVTQVTWNDYWNSPDIGVIVEAELWEGRD